MLMLLSVVLMRLRVLLLLMLLLPLPTWWLLFLLLMLPVCSALLLMLHLPLLTRCQCSSWRLGCSSSCMTQQLLWRLPVWQVQQLSVLCLCWRRVLLAQAHSSMQCRHRLWRMHSCSAACRSWLLLQAWLASPLVLTTTALLGRLPLCKCLLARQ
jgi:hypothetical protein